MAEPTTPPPPPPSAARDAAHALAHAASAETARRIFWPGGLSARLLVLTSSAGDAPGGGFEEFVAVLGRPAEALVPPPPTEPDLERLAGAAAAAGIELLVPSA